MIFYLVLFNFTTFFINPQDYYKEKLHDLETQRLKDQANEVKAIIGRSPNYNNEIAFFIDMKIKSGKNRFFVYDLINDKIIDQGLVANGSGSETGIRGNLQFSNIPNSKCTSLGSYRIGKPYTGIFGKSYKLHGLNETNNNAFKRAIVLHHYSAVPQEEQDYYIINSHGCPMINEEFFKRLEKIIDRSKFNIILNIYY